MSRQPTVEAVIDSELDESDDNFTPMNSAGSDLSGDDSEFDMESDDENDILKKIQTDSELLSFASRLQKAHDQMVSDKKAQWATRKRKATYAGNSNRSKWRWRAEGKKMEEAGFLSMAKYFQKLSDRKSPVRNPGIPTIEVSKSKHKC